MIYKYGEQKRFYENFVKENPGLKVVAFASFKKRAKIMSMEEAILSNHGDKRKFYENFKRENPETRIIAYSTFLKRSRIMPMEEAIIPVMKEARRTRDRTKKIPPHKIRESKYKDEFEKLAEICKEGLTKKGYKTLQGLLMHTHKETPQINPAVVLHKDVIAKKTDGQGIGIKYDDITNKIIIKAYNRQIDEIEEKIQKEEKLNKELNEQYDQLIKEKNDFINLIKK